MGLVTPIMSGIVLKSFSSHVQRKILTQQVAEDLVEMIALGQLKAGDKLPPERSLAEMFSVSRPTISEAIGHLEHRGMVTRRVGSGTYVNDVMSHDRLAEAVEQFVMLRSCSYDELVDFRVIVEPIMAGRAAQRAIDGDVKKLRNLVSLLAKSLEQRNVRKYAKYDVDFHFTLIKMSGNKLITAMYMGILKRFRIWLENHFQSSVVAGDVPDPWDKAFRVHRKILEAFESGDAEVVRSSVIEHLRMAKRDAEAETNE